MKAAERLWRTREGQRLVRDGDQDAAILAYAPGDEVSAADEGNMPAEPKAKPEAKAKPAPANKAQRKPADK